MIFYNIMIFTSIPGQVINLADFKKDNLKDVWKITSIFKSLIQDMIQIYLDRNIERLKISLW